MAAAVLSDGCATAELSQLTPTDQVKYRGTEPGRHSLSPYFVVEIKSNGRATFFHVRDPQDPKSTETIGGQDVYWPRNAYKMAGVMRIADPKFGPRENAYAISEDGRSLLYFTEGGFFMRRREGDSNADAFRAVLHLYRHGLGDSLIASDVDHWESRSRKDPPVPKDAVLFVLPDKRGHPALRGMWERGERAVRSIGEMVPR